MINYEYRFAVNDTLYCKTLCHLHYLNCTHPIYISKYIYKHIYIEQDFDIELEMIMMGFIRNKIR